CGRQPGFRPRKRCRTARSCRASATRRTRPSGPKWSWPAPVRVRYANTHSTAKGPPLRILERVCPRAGKKPLMPALRRRRAGSRLTKYHAALRKGHNMSAAEARPSIDPVADMRRVLDVQKKAHLRDGAPSAEKRIEWLDRSIALLVGHKDAIADALREDFGHRSVESSLFTDVSGSIGPLKHARAHLKGWMKREKRKVSPAILGLLGAKAYIDYQPKGVIGAISPWNFPFNLTFTPLAGIFAAGNRAMIKPSEFTPRSSELMARMFRSAFDESEVAVFAGGPEIGAAFSRLPFDHLLFTGATSIAYHVMKAAAENLVPTTLELGGKSPVIVGDSADMSLAAKRVMQGKTLNAGQICLAPDYVLVPEKKARDFVQQATSAVSTMFPTLKDNPDYTSVINQRHYDRLQGYLDDARAKGAEIIELNPAKEDFRQQPYHKIPPTLVLNPTDD